MQGARKYASLFTTGQHGKLYLAPGSHARGKTFHIFVSPDDTPCSAPWGRKDVVEVYGVLGGNPGWTEYYGWIHHGPWQDDFHRLVKQREKEIAEYENEVKRQKEQEQQEEAKRIAELLSRY